MSAGIHNFTIEQGTTFTTSITILVNENTPRDLTGFSARGQIRETANSSTKIADFVCTIDDSKTGTIKIFLAPEVSTAINKSGNSYANLIKMVYDIEIYKTLENDLEEVYRILNGFVFLSPEVTK